MTLFQKRILEHIEVEIRKAGKGSTHPEMCECTSGKWCIECYIWVIYGEKVGWGLV
jgi:hypothetical protein